MKKWFIPCISLMLLTACNSRDGRGNPDGEDDKLYRMTIGQ